MVSLVLVVLERINRREAQFERTMRAVRYVHRNNQMILP